MKKVSWFLFLVLFLFCSHRCFSVNLLDGLEASYFVLPGSVIEGKLRLINGNQASEEIKIYQEDYLFNSDGTNSFPNPGSSPRSNAKWIKFYPERLILEPGQQGEVSYRIEVPSKGELAGSYWSLMLVEALAADDPTLTGPVDPKSKPSVGIKTQLRYGHQILTTIKDSGRHKLKFKNGAIRKNKNRLFFDVDIENIGDLYSKPVIEMEVFDNKGVALGRLSAGSRQVLPSCSVRFSFDVTDYPSGSYTGLVIANSRDHEVTGRKFSFTTGD